MNLADIKDVGDVLHRGREMLKNAYAPYSDFRVGAVIISKNNKLFDGCNVENTSYSLTVCAEVSAICSMVAAGEREIQAIFIFSHSEQFITPCGGCRQTILEFAGSGDIPVYLVNSRNDIRQYELSTLMPHAFNIESTEAESI